MRKETDLAKIKAVAHTFLVMENQVLNFLKKRS